MADSQTTTLDYVTQRLTNFNTAAEGSVLPPRQRGQYRVPLPSGLQVLQSTTALASTVYTLSWTNVNIGANTIIDHYNIYYRYPQGNSTQQVGPFTAASSPATISIPATIQAPITFFIQTVLSNGMTSTLEASPTTTSVSGVPNITIAPGSITSAMLAPGAVTLPAMAAGLTPIQIVASLPTYNAVTYPQGTVVFNEADNQLYRATGSAWTLAIDGSNLNAASVSNSALVANTITAAKIASGTITSTQIASNTIVAGNISAGAIGAAEIAAGAVDATKVNILQILVVGMTLTNNSPSAGDVAWSSCTVYYNGTGYSISSGNTANQYIYWTVGNSTFTTGATFSPGPNVFLIATNLSGTSDVAWNKVAGGGITGAHMTMPTLLNGPNGSLLLNGIVFSDNSPSSGSVGWSAGTATYKGITYNTGSGNSTNAKFWIYWQLSNPTTIQASATYPSLGADDFLIGLNETFGAGGSLGYFEQAEELHDTHGTRLYILPGQIFCYNSSGQEVFSLSRSAADPPGAGILRLFDGSGTANIVMTGNNGNINGANITASGALSAATVSASSTIGATGNISTSGVFNGTINWNAINATTIGTTPVTLQGYIQTTLNGTGPMYIPYYM